LQDVIFTCDKESQNKLRLMSHVMTNFKTITKAKNERETRIENIIEQVKEMREFMHDIGQ